MTNIVVRMMLIYMLAGLSITFVSTAVIDSSTNQPIFDSTNLGTYDTDTLGNNSPGQEFKDEFSKPVQPSAEMEDKGDSVYRVLDMMSLGFISKTVDFLDKYMHGIINMLDEILGRHMQPTTRAMLFGENERDLNPLNDGILKIIINIGYIFLAVQLFTGHDILNK